MRLESLFHLSFYVTLAVAGGCLTWPSVFFLPWMPAILGAAIILGCLAWKHEGAWVLSETAANNLGVFIAIGAAGWILFQIPRSEEELIMGGVNWPAGLLPHLGPLLIVLLIVKLFRPKRLPDFWVIQTMGLMMVTLAAVLADDVVFGLLALGYLACLVWCLMLYCPVRERALVAAGGDFAQTALFPAWGASIQQPVPWRLWAVAHAVRWTAAVALLGFVFFLLAPRQGQTQWNARQLSTTSPAAVRVFELASIDLNRVGRVELSEEIAFTVSIRDAGGKVVDAGAVDRWRSETLEIYSAGRWYPVSHTKDLLLRRTMSTPVMPPPDPVPAFLEANRRLVTVEVRPSMAGGLVLAEPVDPELGIGLGAKVEEKQDVTSLFHRVEGCDTLASVIQGRRRLHTYSQLLRVPADAAWQPARDLGEEYPSLLANQPAPGMLREWTHDLLARLPGLDADDRDLDARGKLASAPSHAKVAQALCRHLAQSGEFQYTLELRRKDRKLDATVDFLLNVKEGHCERYAGGLALMLRVLGIRCRVVKGYLGLEFDEDGNGFVRLSQAHSWVQALIPGEEPDSWRWLTLDPTPASAVEQSVLDTWMTWISENLLDSRGLWRSLIVDYTPEQQYAMLRAFGRALVTKPGLIILSIMVGLALAATVGVRLVHKSLAVLSLALSGWRWQGASGGRRYQQMLALVRRHTAMAPERGQTPLEFARSVAHRLAAQPGCFAVAHVPEDVVASHYQTLYGDRPLGAADETALDLKVDALRRGLSSLQIA